MAESDKKANKAKLVLTDQQSSDFLFVQKRIIELKESRSDHYGVNLDMIWAEADRDYVPHRLKSKSKRVVATDEEKGWRGALVTLGSNDWQSDISQSNPFVKIQTALSILVDQNPTGVFTPTTKKYEATSELLKQLYTRSWEVAKSKQQLKLFVYNLAKYGWSVARTYPLRIERKVKVLKEYNQENPDKSVYEEKKVVEFNDIMRENIDPRNAWIDDMAKPSNNFSVRDWCWRKVYDMGSAEEEFGKYKNWGMVQAGGVIEETIGQVKGANKTFKSTDLVEVYFYENRIKDIFAVIIGGVPVILEPLPISDAKGLKKLSLWQTYWNIRHAESPYGVGIYEAIRYDQALLDRIRNMTVDQLTLSIYKMFFFQGTQSLTETGDIQIAPGVGKQILDPKNINWLEVPGPGRDAWLGIEMFRKDVDEGSGVGDPLLGNITGKTAFELAQAKEAALKRLKNPLENILEALNQEGYITISLIQLLYSIPETFKVTDQALIEAYLKEIGSDPELYERDEKGNFTAKVFPEFPLNLDKDEKGNLIETKETRFFRVKPKYLEWEGIVNIKSQSLLTPSKQVDKALELEMYNMLIPLLSNPPEIYQKVAKNILKLYEKDPKDILPDTWLAEPEEMQAQQEAAQPLFIEAGQEQGGAPSDQIPGQAGPEARGAERLVSSTQPPVEPRGLVGKIMSKLSGPFRGV